MIRLVSKIKVASYQAIILLEPDIPSKDGQPHQEEVYLIIVDLVIQISIAVMTLLYMIQYMILYMRDVCMCVCRHTFVKPIGCSTENMDPNINYGL